MKLQIWKIILNIIEKKVKSSWTKCNKLVKELEIVQNSEKRLLEELNDIRPKKRRHSVL